MTGKIFKIATASVYSTLISTFLFILVYPLLFACLMSFPFSTEWLTKLGFDPRFGFWDWFGMIFSIRLFLTFILPIKWKMEALPKGVEPSREE